MKYYDSQGKEIVTPKGYTTVTQKIIGGETTTTSPDGTKTITPGTLPRPGYTFGGSRGFSPAPTFRAGQVGLAPTDELKIVKRELEFVSQAPPRVVESLQRQGYSLQEIDRILSGQSQTIASQLQQQSSLSDRPLPASFFQVKQRTQELQELERLRQEQEARVSGVELKISDYEKQVGDYSSKYLGRELSQADYNRAQQEKTRLDALRKEIEVSVSETQLMGRVTSKKFESITKNLSEIEKKAAIESVSTLQQQQFLRQSLGLVSASIPSVPRELARIEAYDPLQSIVRQPSKLGEPVQLVSTSGLDARVPLSGQQQTIVAPKLPIITSISTGLSSVVEGLKKSIEISEGQAVTSGTKITRPTSVIKQNDFIKSGDLEQRLVSDQPLSIRDRISVEPNIEKSRQTLLKQLSATATTALYVLPTGTAITGAGRLIAGTKVGKVLSKSKFLSVTKTQWDKLFGTRVVQDVDVLLPTRIRTQTQLQQELLATVSKGLAKGQTKVVGIGKFNLGKVYSSTPFVLKAKTKTLFKLDDLIEKKVKIVFDKSLTPKALGTKAKVVKLNFDDVGSSVATLSKNKIRFSGDQALEQMRNVADTSLFSLTSKQRIGDVTRKVSTKLGVSASKGKATTQVLAFKEREVIAQQTKFVLRLEPTKTLGAKRVLPTTLARSDLIETKTDYGMRVVGKLQQRTVDLIETPKTLKVVKVSVGANVSIVKTPRFLAQQSGWLEPVSSIGVSLKGVGKKSSKVFLDKLMAKTTPSALKTARITSLAKSKSIGETVLSRKELLKILDSSSVKTSSVPLTKKVISASKQVPPVTNISNQVVSGSGTKLLAKTSVPITTKARTSTGFSGVQVQQAVFLNTQKALKQFNIETSKIASRASSIIGLKRTEPLLAGSRVFSISSVRTSSSVSPTNVFSPQKIMTIQQPVFKSGQIEKLTSISPTLSKIVSPIKTVVPIRTSELSVTRIVSPQATKIVSPIKTVDVQMTKTITPTKVGQMQAVKTLTSLKTSLKTATLTKTTIVPRVITPIKVPIPPIVPPPFIWPGFKSGSTGFARPRLPRVSDAYKVVTRVRGKERVLRVGVPKNVAIKVGSRFVGETPARSFKIVKVGLTRKRDVPIRVPMYKFREPVALGQVAREGYKFVEKSKYAIESPGEKAGIPGKAQRLRRAGLIGKKGLLKIPKSLI